MWLAETSPSDGIAIVVFATVLFSLLFGLVAFVRWVFGVVSRKTAPEAVMLVFQANYGEDGDECEEGNGELENFAWFLHAKLHERQLGHFSNWSAEGDHGIMRFEGPNADHIWQLLDAEAKSHAAPRPLRVILERSKRNGGKLILDAVSWQPVGPPVPQSAVTVAVPEVWRKLSHYSRALTAFGMVGIFAWGMFRKFLKLSENEFRDTIWGNYSAWIMGILLISGLCLQFVCGIRIRSIEKQAGLFARESTTSVILKYVLLMVLLIFGLVLVLLV